MTHHVVSTSPDIVRFNGFTSRPALGSRPLLFWPTRVCSVDMPGGGIILCLRPIVERLGVLEAAAVCPFKCDKVDVLGLSAVGILLAHCGVHLWVLLTRIAEPYPHLRCGYALPPSVTSALFIAMVVSRSRGNSAAANPPIASAACAKRLVASRCVTVNPQPETMLQDQTPATHIRRLQFHIDSLRTGRTRCSSGIRLDFRSQRLSGDRPPRSRRRHGVTRPSFTHGAVSLLINSATLSWRPPLSTT